MFTIKHISPMGDECLFQGDEPMFLRNHGSMTNPPAPDSFRYTSNSGAIMALEDGTVYVMNDLGRTVATYRFGDENQIHTGSAR